MPQTTTISSQLIVVYVCSILDYFWRTCFVID